MSEPAFPDLSCPACGDPMENRPTHAGKPHYVCNPCGTQLFVRREEGIERLRERAGRKAPKGGFWA